MSTILQWGSIAEWVSGIATLFAVVVALSLGLSDGKRREMRNNRSQAEKISVWQSENQALISNSSEEPIYEVAISFGVAYGAGQKYDSENDNQALILRVPPGRYRTKLPKSHGGGMHMQLGLSISFRDAKGRYWRRDASGSLVEIPIAFEGLNINHPISNWQTIFEVE